MLATLIGSICLFIGFAVLFLPILITELSRPRDEICGAVFLLLALVLITSHDLLRGPPMLAVLSGTFLLGSLGVEVAQLRWQQLSQDEKLRLRSRERWLKSFQELNAALRSLVTLFGETLKLFGPKQSATSKKWVRPEIDKDPQSGKELQNQAIKNLPHQKQFKEKI